MNDYMNNLHFTLINNIDLHDRGLDVSKVKGYNSYTPLHYAVQYAHAHLIFELIKLGGNSILYYLKFS